MSRLQKKCFIGATGFHLLLLALLIVGPAFLSPGEPDSSPVLEFIPTITTETQVSGGGTPRPATASATATPTPRQPQPQPQPQPQVQKPVPQPPPERQPDPPKVEKPKDPKPDPDSVESKPTKPTHKVQISDKVIKPRDQKTPAKPSTDATATAAANAAAATARAAAAAERKQQFAAALKNISSGLTSSTTIEMPDGPGGGGASYASYRDEVRRIYFEAWRIPDDVTDDEATVKVSVTIARDGHVISSRITQSSGSKLVDKSIQATLDRVPFVRAFPDGSRDSQKTFNIGFSLKAKKLG